MRKTFAILAAVSALALAQPASATVVPPGATPGTPVGSNAFFYVFGNPFTGTEEVTANIGDTIKKGSINSPFSFTDDFRFSIGPSGGALIGSGSGRVITGSTRFFIKSDLDFTSITVNGVSLLIQSMDGGLNEFATTSNVPIYSGVLNDIVVTGLSRGLGSFSGTLTFEPNAVPEPATWALMLIGFGFMGMAFRRRRPLAVQTA